MYLLLLMYNHLFCEIKMLLIHSYKVFFLIVKGFTSEFTDLDTDPCVDFSFCCITFNPMDFSLEQNMLFVSRQTFILY